MNRDPIGITCPTHGLQAGRTICKWCHYDPLKVPPYDDGLRASVVLPRTSYVTSGDRGVFIPCNVNQDAAHPITDMAS